MLREYSGLRQMLIVIRCPKLTARPWHGLLPAKPMTLKQKTGDSGVAVTPRRMFVSDYDLMSIWRRADQGLRKVFVSSTTSNPRGPLTEEAKVILRELNASLVSRIQHGCQDDFHSVNNPGVKSNDHFAGFLQGAVDHLANPGECAQPMQKHGLPWTYDAGGKYVGPTSR